MLHQIAWLYKRVSADNLFWNLFPEDETRGFGLTMLKLGYNRAHYTRTTAQDSSDLANEQEQIGPFRLTIQEKSAGKKIRNLAIDITHDDNEIPTLLSIEARVSGSNWADVDVQKVRLFDPAENVRVDITTPGNLMGATGNLLKELRAMQGELEPQHITQLFEHFTGNPVPFEASKAALSLNSA